MGGVLREAPINIETWPTTMNPLLAASLVELVRHAAVSPHTALLVHWDVELKRMARLATT